MPQANPQSSFIPHDTEFGIRRRVSPTGIVDLAALIAIVVFVASGTLAGAVFIYQINRQQARDSKHDQLERAKRDFDVSLIKKLTRLDDRMNAANKILSSHVALSPFFHTLEKTTVSTIGFRTLNFEVADQTAVNVKMSGIANSVNSVAYQADQFGDSGVFKNPIFSNIDRGELGVNFQVTSAVNPRSVSYTQSLESGAAQLPQLPSNMGSTTSASLPSSPFEGPQKMPLPGQ